MRQKQDTQLYINIAPLVDVMLVLLVIFMVTAPMMHASIDINLPKTDEGQTISTEKPKTIVVSMNKTGDIFVGTEKVDIKTLGKYLKENIKKDDQIQLKADENLHFSKVFSAIDKLVKSGYGKLSLIAEVQ